MDAYLAQEQEVLRILSQSQAAGNASLGQAAGYGSQGQAVEQGSPGQNPAESAAPPVGKIVIYVENPRAVKELHIRGKMYLAADMLRALEKAFGKDNVSAAPGRAPL